MKIITLLTGLLLCATPVLAQFSGDTFEEAQEQGEAEITAHYLEEDAFAYYEGGELQGIHHDIFERFVSWAEQEYGIDITVNWEGEAESFSRFYSNVEESDGGVFGLGTVTILEERRQEVQFTPPYIVNIAVLATHETVPEVDSWDEATEQLNNLTGISIPGTTLETRMEYLQDNYLPDLEFVDVASQHEAMEQIDQNPDQFTYVDLAVYWPLREVLDLQRHEFADEPGEEFGYIMPLDSDWQEPITRFFTLGSGFETTSSYRNIIMEHLGEEVHQMLQLARRDMD